MLLLGHYGSSHCCFFSKIATERLEKPSISSLCLQGIIMSIQEVATRGGGGGVVLGSIFAGYVLLASLNSYSIIVYSVVNHRPHLSHF